MDAEFEQWLEKVNRQVQRITGGMISIYDLADFLYYDAYEDGATPSEVAYEVLENEGFSFA